MIQTQSPWVRRNHHAVLALAQALAWSAGLAPRAALAADEATFTVRLLTPETALAAARAALEHCRQQRLPGGGGRGRPRRHFAGAVA